MSALRAEKVKSMKINITARKITVTEAFRNRSEKKLAKLDKFFDADAEANLVVSEIRDKVTVEVTVRNKSLVFRAERTAADGVDALEAACDAIVKQIVKNKGRLATRYSKEAIDSIPEDLPEEPMDLVKRKSFPVKPMDVEEAILQMDLSGHEFFLFQNVKTGEINLVYRRKNGGYGLLEPERL